MSSGEQIRVGLIGCGYQGQWLAQAVNDADGLVLTGCVDPDGEAVSKVASIAKGNVRTYPNPEALLAKGQVDAVLIATPHNLLHPYAMLAIESGKHVLAEKPIALNAEQGKELQTAKADRGVTYMSGYSFRYFGPIARARKLLAEGVIGDIKTIQATMTVPRLREGWPCDPAAGGGMLGFFGCHVIDRVLWYSQDDPREVYAQVRYNPATGVDTASVFQIRFEKGTSAQINLCVGAHGPFDTMNVYGDTGYLALTAEVFPRYSLTVFTPGDAGLQPQRISAIRSTREEAILGKMVAELDDFAAACIKGEQPAISANDGRRVLEIMDAVVQSARMSKPIIFS